jgi:transcriptional regulator with XRE-family HTH domain
LDDSDKAVGRRVRLVRKAHSLTGQQLADKLGITTSSLSYIESGDRRLDPRHASKLLLLYGVDHTWLYCGLPSGLTDTTLKRLEEAERASSSGSESSRSA